MLLAMAAGMLLLFALIFFVARTVLLDGYSKLEKDKTNILKIGRASCRERVLWVTGVQTCALPICLRPKMLLAMAAGMLLLFALIFFVARTVLLDGYSKDRKSVV